MLQINNYSHKKILAKKVSYATVGKKYQIVIPNEVRKNLAKLKPGSKVNVDALDENTISITVLNKSWSDENYGALKKYWKKIDLIKEIEKMRDEWDKKI